MSFVPSFGQKSFFFKNKLQIGIETQVKFKNLKLYN